MKTQARNSLGILFTPSKLRRWLLVFLVGLVTLASYWALEIIRSHSSEETNAVRTRPDYFVENFNFVKMTPEGQSKYRLVGTKLVHYPEDDHANITLPVMTNLDPAQPRITVRSERAVVKNIANQPENEVHLYDKVVVNRPKTDTAEHLQLNTDYLLAYPDKNTAETNFPVEIISGDTITTGVGLKANNATQQIEILSHVHSIIPPRPRKKVTVTQ